jgi:hypothetical protein
MTTLEEEIEKVKQKHAELELQQYRDKLHAKYEELKKKEGLVEVRIQKSSKTTRWVNIYHHISYELMTDKWTRKDEKEHEYIGFKCRSIQILESKTGSYPRYEVTTRETKPTDYDGKIHAKEDTPGVDFSTHKTISVEEFNALFDLQKVHIKNILDGLLDISDVRWVMNGTSHDQEFKETDLLDAKSRKVLDIPYYLCETTEEAWILEKAGSVFLNKNIYFITPNSLRALDEWLEKEREWDSFSARACASVGERWRGSRIDQYEALVKKIKRVAKS